MLSEELEKVLIGQNEEKYFQVRSQLPSLEKVALMKLLEDNIDVFAWSTYNLPGIDLEFICHWLNVNSDTFPRKQPPRCSLKEHAEAVKVEVNKLKQVGASKGNQGNLLPRVTSQFRGSEEEKREMTCMRGFHGFE